MSGMAVLVAEYCIEAKMRLAARVCRALLVQAATKLLSRFLPELFWASGAKFHSVIMIGSSVLIVFCMTERASRMWKPQSSILARHSLGADLSSQVYSCQLMASGRGLACLRKVLRYLGLYLKLTGPMNCAFLAVPLSSGMSAFH